MFGRILLELFAFGLSHVRLLLAPRVQGDAPCRHSAQRLLVHWIQHNAMAMVQCAYGHRRGRFGLGMAPVLYNFAYGANMNDGKLRASRGLQPLASKPARLPGWRLAFNHRCAGSLHCTPQTVDAESSAGCNKNSNHEYQP